MQAAARKRLRAVIEVGRITANNKTAMISHVICVVEDFPVIGLCTIKCNCIIYILPFILLPVRFGALKGAS